MTPKPDHEDAGDLSLHVQSPIDPGIDQGATVGRPRKRGRVQGRLLGSCNVPTYGMGLVYGTGIGFQDRGLQQQEQRR